MYDVVVVGGGPAGSYSADLISKAGFNVLIVEEHAVVGEPVQCAGLVTPRVFEMVDFTGKCILNKVRGAEIYSPSGERLTIGGQGVKAVVIDRANFDRLILDHAVNRGVEVKTGSRALDFEWDGATWTIKMQGGDIVRSRLLIGADGAGSATRSILGIRPPRYFINAMGAELEGVDIDPDMVRIFVGNEVAPNFFAWMIPSGERVRLGLGVRDSSQSLNHYYNLLFNKTMASDILKDGRVIAKSSGRIPIGMLDRTHGEGAMLVGDAASQVKATSGGGIYPGLVCARYCAETAVSCLEKGETGEKALSRYHKDWNKDIGDELKKDVLIHRVYSTVTDNQFDELFEMLNRDEILEIINRSGDIDYPSRLAWMLLKKEPRFLKYTGKFLKVGLGGQWQLSNRWK